MSDVLEIENLRRLYAKATDLIALGGHERVEGARAIYHQIFTPDVDIKTSPGPDALTANSPDQWVDVVADALEQYQSTQHMIGSQLVQLNGDQAHMESYLSAWHQRGDGSVMVFLGTYVDSVRKDRSGWQIHAMDLQRTMVYELPAQ
ncbi:MAG: nuclear transport factor 2 family protein [Pseudomonadota bacterium]